MENNPFQKHHFGEIAIQKNYITVGQLLNALNTQVMDIIEKKEHRLIGTILREEGFVTIAQIHEVLTAKYRL